MRENNTNGYMAMGNKGSSFQLPPMTRAEARQAALGKGWINGENMIGIIDLEDIGSNFARLARELNISSRRQLETAVHLVGSIPASTIDDLFAELEKRTATAIPESEYKPFSIDRERVEALDEFQNAMWHDHQTKDRDTVLALFEAAQRAHAIHEPTVGGSELTLGLMAVAPHPTLPATDVFFRMYSPAFEHLVGDILPLEGCEFFEQAAEIAGSEEGPGYGLAVLELILARFAYVYRDLQPYLTSAEIEATKRDDLVAQEA